MSTEQEKIARAKTVLKDLANGVNPYTGAEIESSSIIHDPRLIRCLHFVVEVLTAAEAGPKGSWKGPAGFAITAEEKSRIELPPGKVGVNQFAKCVNLVLDPARSKQLTGMEINRGLKRLGVLGEETGPDGKKRTVLTARSAEVGIGTEMRNFQGNEYEMVLFDEAGKRFLVENLELIMGQGEKEQG